MLEKLQLHPPRYGPEWGSGGVFGLRYHRGVLYYTLAFESRSYFIRDDAVREYDFSEVGPGPRSGGDTYNAVDAVDEKIYFGGWVHAPAVYKGGGRGRRVIDFRNKHSHLHEYDINEDRVRLLWKECIGHPENWAGEVSEVVYDPVNDRLLLARGDGHENLGVYSVGRGGGRATRLVGRPVLKGCLHLEQACFNAVEKGWGVNSLCFIDLVDGRVEFQEVRDYSRVSADKGGVWLPLPGPVASAYARVFSFVRGGVLTYSHGDGLCFTRLLDFSRSGYGPLRTQAREVGGGVLVAFNSYTHGIINPADDREEALGSAFNNLVGPSLLLYLTPPTVRVVAALGARVTGVEVVGTRVLLATNTSPNLMRYDSTPIDVGVRGFLAMDSGSVALGPPPPVSFAVKGGMVMNDVWGGVPLHGYKEPSLVLRLTKPNKLTVYDYDLSTPPGGAEASRVQLGEGRNVVDLSGYKRIVSFRLEDPDPGALIHVHLA